MTALSRTALLVIVSVIILAFGAVARADMSVLTSFTQSAENAFELSFDGIADAEILVLDNPPRIALDLPETVTAVRPPALAASPLVDTVRDGLVGADRYRILFGLKSHAAPKLDRREEDGRTVLDLSFRAIDAGAFAATAGRRTGRDGTTVRPNAADREIVYTIVLDPGHGGIDNGAVGAGGTLEKDLNLAFARVLKEELENDAHVRVVLTRDDDTLLPLSERSAIGRREAADLFVSLHADSIRFKDLRGATVYTLAETASDQLSQEVADSENAADRFVGPGWESDTPEIHDILVDLVRRETEILSERLARNLVLSLRGNEIRLINNPKRSAGFRVLRAPDIPSVLLELGYLSNEEDETLMGTPEWQSDMAGAVAAAIGSFLQSRSALAR